MDVQMSKTHQTTYNAIFGHPIAKNLQWREIESMLSSIAEVTEQHNGSLKFVRHGQTLTIHPPKHKDFSDTDELMKIRHFLDRSAAPEQASTEDKHLLVLIDHREAKIYQLDPRDSMPERIEPYDPDGLHRHLHYVEGESAGQRQPELKSFYEAVAQTLRGAEQITIFGSSTGTSSAMEQLVADLKHNHPDIARKVVGTIVVNEHHITENQLLAQARELYTPAEENWHGMSLKTSN
jgi:hypothetical protein